MNDPNKHNIYITAAVRRRLLEACGDWGLSLSGYLEKVFNLRREEKEKPVDEDDAGYISFPLHIADGLKRLSEERNFDTVNTMLADFLCVDPVRRGPPSKFDVSDLAVGESREFAGGDHLKVVKFLDKYKTGSGRHFVIDYFPVVDTVRVLRMK